MSSIPILADNERNGRPIDRVVSHLEAVHRKGTGYVARCPAHDDGRPSLKVDEADDGRVLLYCHAGCDTARIVEAMGLTFSDLFSDERTHGPRLVTSTSSAVYQYHSRSGDVLFEVVRKPGKKFMQRRPDGKGGWIWDLEGIEPPLYRLPDLVREPNRWVALTEGEKDADRLQSLGILATTAPMGASAAWLDSYTETLKGHPVAILADNDQPGRERAYKVAVALHTAGVKVKVVEFPGVPSKGDVSDWLDMGHSKHDLLELMKDTPEWCPEHQAVEPAEERAQSQAVVLSLSTIKPRAVDWLWDQWLARGKLHLFGGHPGDGKSTITLALAAAFSRGGLLPDGTRAPVCNVLLVLAEDDLEDTVRPRLDLHHADPNRIWAIKLIKDEKGNDRALSLSGHINEMRAVIEAYHIDVVVIDPITSYLPKADRNAEGDVRDALTPFVSLIEHTGIAAIGVMHVGKSSGQGRRPLQMLLGSTAFGAMARVVWMTAQLPDEEQPEPGGDGIRETRKLLGVVKSNISILPAPLEWTRPLDGPIRWHGKSTHRMDDVLAGAGENPIETAKKFLLEHLAGGSRAASEILDLAKDADISEKTLRRAKFDLKIEKFKERGAHNGRWFWKLPNGTDTVATFQDEQDKEDGHSSNMATFPEHQEDGHASPHGRLRHSPNGSTEDGQPAQIGNMATLRSADLMPTGTDGEWRPF